MWADKFDIIVLHQLCSRHVSKAILKYIKDKGASIDKPQNFFIEVKALLTTLSECT